jgi:hypothetical protein
LACRPEFLVRLLNAILKKLIVGFFIHGNPETIEGRVWEFFTKYAGKRR